MNPDSTMIMYLTLVEVCASVVMKVEVVGDVAGDVVAKVQEGVCEACEVVDDLPDLVEESVQEVLGDLLYVKGYFWDHMGVV